MKTIEVKAGWKEGTKIKYPEEGDQSPGVIPADIEFVVKEKPHDRFKRDGNNLVMTVTLPLKDALCGTTIQVPTLDGRRLSVTIPSVSSPNYQHRVKGEGMPISKRPGTKGDLVISFNISFPSLSEAQKAQLRQIL